SGRSLVSVRMFRLILRAAGPPGPLSAGSARLLSGSAPELPAALVRSTFLDFFQQKHRHRLVPSSPVRPRADPSLLFVNAGMNQFKPLLLGTAHPRSEMASYRRVVNSQKCVRAGGKHNDLEDVGRDLNHHTFFEMLGTWSFGDYFKWGNVTVMDVSIMDCVPPPPPACLSHPQEEACLMAWSLLTEHYGIPADRLYVSYFCGDAASGLVADEETRQIWLDMGVPPGRLLPFGLKENFWEMGDSGPCGPCTEIHYDHVGGRDTAELVNGDSPDVVEIWNLVFMQYSRFIHTPGPSLRLLPQFSVDTGMGLERLVSILQGKRSNYDTDLFTPLLHEIHRRSKVRPYGGRTGVADEGKMDTAYQVVADHIRTLSVCIADGVHPGMSGAELVLRRILRRAVRFCAEVLQVPQGGLASLVPTVAHILGDVYPELHSEADRIMDVINENEAHFLLSLQQGSRLIYRTLNKMDYKDGVFPASVAWSLHRDLGFPLDLVDLMLGGERGPGGPSGAGPTHGREPEAAVNIFVIHYVATPVSLRWSLIRRQVFSLKVMLDVFSLAELQRHEVPHTDNGLKYQYRLEQGRYEQTRTYLSAVQCSQHAVRQSWLCMTVRVWCQRSARVSAVEVILDQTSFYSEQGGQSCDQGYITRDGLQDVLYPVEAVVLAGGYVIHQVNAGDGLKTGDWVKLHLDQVNTGKHSSLACMVKHTATHILNFALREVVSPSVQQRGSHVSADRLRFDFSVKGSLSVSQLQQVERCVSDVISANQIIHSQELSSADSEEHHRPEDGGRGEESVYPDPVRVVSVGVPVSELLDDQTDRNTSVELCCGTHLLQTGAVQDLVIVSERQLVKGISRIVAVTTGQEATQAWEAGQTLSQDVDSLTARLTGSAPSDIGSAQHLAKEVGVLSDAVDNTPIPQWQRRELQARLKALQRSSNTTVRKLETRERRARALLEKNSVKDVQVDSVETDSLSIVMKTVNQLSDAAPHSHVMLFAHQRHSGKVLCACQVPKDSPFLSVSLIGQWRCVITSGAVLAASALVAKGTGSSSDITEVLRWAEEFARQKTQR
ncbi:hypothetical protein L3Q82_020186, partial [Scortum barcoo]